MEEKRAAEPEVLWHEERETLTLDGEPVLEYALAWPEITGASAGTMLGWRRYGGGGGGRKFT